MRCRISLQNPPFSLNCLFFWYSLFTDPFCALTATAAAVLKENIVQGYCVTVVFPHIYYYMVHVSLPQCYHRWRCPLFTTDPLHPARAPAGEKDALLKLLFERKQSSESPFRCTVYFFWSYSSSDSNHNTPLNQARPC